MRITIALRDLSSTAAVRPTARPKVEQGLRCIVPYKNIERGDTVTLMVVNGDVGTLMTAAGRIKIDLNIVWEYFRPQKGQVSMSGVVTHLRKAYHTSKANKHAVEMETTKLKAATINAAYKVLRIKNEKSKKVLEKLRKKAEDHRLKIEKHAAALAKIRAAEAAKKQSTSKPH